MSASIKYNLHFCRDCERDFLSRLRETGKTTRTAYCPLCGENIFVDRLRVVRMKPYVMKNTSYRPKEDEILVEGMRRGMTARQISAELDDRSIRSVYDRIRVLRQKGLIPDKRTGSDSRVGVHS